MKHFLQFFAFTILWVTLVLGAPVYAATTELPFDLAAGFGELKSTTLNLRESGCLVVAVDGWSASTGTTKAMKIALVLNGPDKVEAYARIDGVPTTTTPLWTSVSVSRVGQWKVTVANFDRLGGAKGTARIIYPPTAIPCEFRATARKDGTVSMSWNSPQRVIVERANGARWEVVPGCSATSCVDTTTRHGSSYLYRACAALGSSVCSSGEATTSPRSVVVR